MALWSIEWLVRTKGGEREVPAFSFLLVQPAAVRIQLLAIVDAVRTTGPDRWKDRTSHDSMHGVCAQLHEARDRHGHMLYRLYLRWQRHHNRVVIDGGAKPNSTTLPDSLMRISPRWRQQPNSPRPRLRRPTTSHGSRLTYWPMSDSRAAFAASRISIACCVIVSSNTNVSPRSSYRKVRPVLAAFSIRLSPSSSPHM